MPNVQIYHTTALTVPPLLLQAGLWVNISLRAAGLNILSLTVFGPILSGLVVEEHP